MDMGTITDNKSMIKSPTSRMLLWISGRCLSTVFLRALSNLSNAQLICEPYHAARQLGPERLPEVARPGQMEALNRCADFPKNYTASRIQFKLALDDDKFTYSSVKKMLEDDYPGKTVVLCKDLSSAMDRSKYHTLPNGYRHSYIVRHPYKSVLSWKKYIAAQLNVPVESLCIQDMPTILLIIRRGYEEMLNLIEYLKERGDEPDPIVIDADDLQRNPSSIMRQYCQAVGLPFSDNLLKWNPEEAPDQISQWIGSKTDLIGGFLPWGCYHAVLKTTSFLPLGKSPSRDELPQDVVQCADEVMPYYVQIHRMRIRP